MKKSRFLILSVLSLLTGLTLMHGCSPHQETLSWQDVIADIRKKYHAEDQGLISP